jgi:hypothetical protein
MDTKKTAGASHDGTPKPDGVKRRDATGHLDPKYAAELRAKSGESTKGDDHAFLMHARSNEPLAERLGEEFVASATSGESEAERSPGDEVTSDEVGGPFVVTTGKKEFAKGTDRSNPKGATREPFPRT